MAWFVISAALLVWPAFHWWGNTIEPRILGLPWSLCYVLLIVLVNFAALVGLYLAGWVDASEPELDEP